MSTDKLSKGAFAVCKDRSHERQAGKYANRAKGQKPENRLVKVLEERCEKKCFRSVDRVKYAVQKAENARMRAEQEGRTTKRRELRWFECYSHGVKMYHLTSVDEAEYIARFEASKRGEYVLAA